MNAEKMILDIYDYNNNEICPLYDNQATISGQATNVCVTTERNGWRELSFQLPTKCHTENGEEENFRVQYIRPEYKIRMETDDDVNWFLLTTPKIAHSGHMKTLDVVAQDVSCLLKVKNLGLSFSDEEGNNVGTAEQLLTTILDGTGWTVGNVYAFAEDDGSPKYRSLKASSKTGAFKLITMMCDLFDAKPIFHGDARTVDIVPINPFSEKYSDEHGIPTGVSDAEVIELHYGKNVANVNRTLESENIVTKFYAYGSYGDKTHGYCGIDECYHTIVKIRLKEQATAGTTYYFSFTDDMGVVTYRSFTPKENIANGTVLEYSLLDPASMMYLWNPNGSEGMKAVAVDKEQKGTELKYDIVVPGTTTSRFMWTLLDDDFKGSMVSTELKNDDTNDIMISLGNGLNGTYNMTVSTWVTGDASQANTKVYTGNDYKCYIKPNTNFSVIISKNDGADITSEEATYVANKIVIAFAQVNQFSFLFDFDYYKEAELFTDEMLQKLAEYQHEAPAIYQRIADAQAQMSADRTTLSKQIATVNFCRLNVAKVLPKKSSTYLRLTLRKNAKYPDGVIYRTDYAEKPENYFDWYTAAALDQHGEPTSSIASVLYIIHKTNPITWDKMYLKQVDNADDPTTLTFWAKRDDVSVNVGTDKFYLFEHNGAGGQIGSFESADEATVRALNDATKVVTVEHPVYFTSNFEQFQNEHPAADVPSYAWVWVYDPTGKKDSVLRFSYQEIKDNMQNSAWQIVYISDTEPERDYTDQSQHNYQYWYNWQTGKLYIALNQTWKELDQDRHRKPISYFDTVISACYNRDKYYQGMKDKYVYTATTDDPDYNSSNHQIPADNYYMHSEYDTFWVFTTPSNMDVGDTLTYVRDDDQVVICHGNSDIALDTKSYRFDNVKYNPENIFNGVLEHGSISPSTGEIADQEASLVHLRTVSYGRVYSNRHYKIKVNTNNDVDCRVVYYSGAKTFIEATDFKVHRNEEYDLLIPKTVEYVKLVIFNQADTNLGFYMHYGAWDRSVIINDEIYKEKTPAIGQGKNNGLINSFKVFSDISDQTYIDDYNALKQAQDELKALEQALILALGDVLREGYWQDDSYVDGDELKLYKDAIEKVEQISKPEASYNVTYLDLRYAQPDDDQYHTHVDSDQFLWPNLTTASAIHLVDPELHINTWAYVDKVKRCYDKPFETTVQINTNLSTMTQHTFTDVLENIANVASDAKAAASTKTTVVGKASGLTAGALAQISATVVNQLGGKLSANGISDLTTSPLFQAALNSAISNYSGQSGITIGAAQIDDLRATVAQIATALINQAVIDVANINVANIDNADIKYAMIKALAATDATLDKATINYAKIKYQESEQAGVEYLFSDTAVGDKVYAARLSVNEANIVSLTVGQLTVRGADGKYYRILPQDASAVVDINENNMTDVIYNSNTSIWTDGYINAQTGKESSEINQPDIWYIRTDRYIDNYIKAIKTSTKYSIGVYVYEQTTDSGTGNVTHTYLGRWTGETLQTSAEDGQSKEPYATDITFVNLQDIQDKVDELYPTSTHVLSYKCVLRYSAEYMALTETSVYPEAENDSVYCLFGTIPGIIQEDSETPTYSIQEAKINTNNINVAEVCAEDGTFLNLVAKNIHVDELFARAAEIGQLQTSTIEALSNSLKLENNASVIQMMEDKIEASVDDYVTQMKMAATLDTDGLRLRKYTDDGEAREGYYSTLIDDEGLAIQDPANKSIAEFKASGAFIDNLRAKDTLAIGSDDDDLGWYDFIMLSNGLGIKWRNPS